MPVVLIFALSACNGGQASPESSATAKADASGSTAQKTAATTDPPTTQSGANAAAPVIRFGERQIDHPDDLQMLMLAYRLEGREPPIGEWAAAQSRVAYADEFERPALLEEERLRLQGIYDGTADVGRLRMNVNARFGEYDAARGGYYLDAFLPGSRFNFTAQPSPLTSAQRIGLQVENTGEMNFWPLDMAAAKGVLERNRRLRDVVLDSRFRIAGVSRSGDGPVIAVSLAGYAIGSHRTGAPMTFGELRFDSAGPGGP